MPPSVAKGSGGACVIITDASITATAAGRFSADPQRSMPVEVEHATSQRHAQRTTLGDGGAQARDGVLHALQARMTRLVAVRRERHGQDSHRDLERLVAKSRREAAWILLRSPADRRQNLARFGTESLLVPLRALGEMAQALGREAFRTKSGKELAPARPRIAVVHVRGILDESPAFLSTKVDQNAFSYAKERPHMADSIPIDLGPHAGEPRDPRASRKAHQDRLGLVVAGMGRREMTGPVPAGLTDEELVAFRPRGFLDARPGLRSRPDEGPVRDFELCGVIRDGRGRCRRFRT